MEIDLGFWNANGYYVLPQFFSQAETEAILEEDCAWASRSDQIIVDNQIYNPHQPRIRSSIGGLSAEQPRGNRKLRSHPAQLCVPLPRPGRPGPRNAESASEGPGRRLLVRPGRPGADDLLKRAICRTQTL